MKKHYHFIGIGGTGLSAIARVLLEQGQIVSGSDIIISPLAKELEELGVKVFEGHNAENVKDANLVIRSSAIPDTNIEVIEAQNLQIPVLKRKDFLGEITSDKDLLAVAGTHGKTTTTAMLSWVFHKLGLDPSYIIGSDSKNLESNAHSGKGEYFIIEADEYDSMFLGLNPYCLIIPTIEHDHPDNYPTEKSYFDAFKSLLRQTKKDGMLFIFADHPKTKSFGEWAKKIVNVYFYGKSKEADYRVSDISHEANKGVKFKLTFPDGTICHQKLIVPGSHNAFNASAVLCLVHKLGLSTKNASRALEQFSGSGRRFDTLATVNGITLIDDYAHHPTEINATIQATKGLYPTRRLWTVWQPHTYSRTQELYGDFVNAFTESDEVIVIEIYPSREKKQDYSSSKIANDIKNTNVKFISGLEDTAKYLVNNLESGDVVLVLSAGDADQINRKILESFSAENVRSNDGC